MHEYRWHGFESKGKQRNEYRWHVTCGCTAHKAGACACNKSSGSERKRAETGEGGQQGREGRGRERTGEDRERMRERTQKEAYSVQE